MTGNQRYYRLVRHYTIIIIVPERNDLKIYNMLLKERFPNIQFKMLMRNYKMNYY